jgi:beta-N-acetylhexosaminidase
VRRLAVALIASMLAACATPAAQVSPSAAPSSSTGPAPTASGPTQMPPTQSPAPTSGAVAPSATPTPSQAPAAPTLAQLIGQKLVIRMQGLTPSASLLTRVRRGEIGGMILFGSNVSSPAQVSALTATLQAAAAAGGQPPLLIATDQEGGTIKRIPWAAPTLSPPDMGSIGQTSVARSQGLATGQALHALGIDCDLAPVADVPVSTDSFMYQEGRTWSFDAAVTSSLSNAFARGLRLAGVVAVMKHFPGIGLATQNTDAFVVTLAASQAELAPGIQPYVTAIGRGIPMIMLSNATYTAFDPVNGAGWSRTIVKGLLRDQLGFSGVTITDSLSGTAKARGIPVSQLVLQAAIAGTDMILVTGSEASTQAIYEALLSDARAGLIPRGRLEASYDRILALKAGL